MYEYDQTPPTEAELEQIMRENEALAMAGFEDVSLRYERRAPYSHVTLVVASAVEAMDFTSDTSWACISIASSESSLPKLSAKNRKGLLQLTFNDVESEISGRSGRSFSQADAREVLDFVYEMSHDIETLLIHCEKGESRSAGVAAGISELFGRSPADFTHGRMQPNSLVFGILRDNMAPIDYDEEPHFNWDEL